MGFTLIELVLVIALLGILAMAVVTFTPSPSLARLDSASKQVSSDIEYVRQSAMTRETVHGIEFIANGNYTAYQTSTATPVLDPLTKQNMIVNFSSFYSGVSIQNNYTVEFDRFGKPIGGGGSVTLTNGSTTKIISVQANTGRVSIQ